MLWSDGSMHSCDVGKGGGDLGTSSSELTSQPIAKFGVFKLARPALTVLTATSSTHVLVVANSTNGSVTALLWDTTYSTLQAELELDKVPNVGRSKSGPVGAIRKGPTCAVIAMESSVVAVDIPENATSGTLAGALNKLSDSSAKLAPDWDATVSVPPIAHALRWVPIAQSTKPGEDWVARGAKREAELTKLLAVVLDTKKTSTFERLMAALEEYFAKFSYTIEPKNPKRAKKIKVENGAFQYHAIQMMKRLLAEKRYFPGKAIVRLLKRQCISYSHCPGVIEAGLGPTREHKAVLHAAMHHLDGVNENVVISCLETLFARKDDGQAEDGQEPELDAFLRLVCPSPPPCLSPTFPYLLFLFFSSALPFSPIS